MCAAVQVMAAKILKSNVHFLVTSVNFIQLVINWGGEGRGGEGRGGDT